MTEIGRPLRRYKIKPQPRQPSEKPPMRRVEPPSRQEPPQPEPATLPEPSRVG